MLLTRYEFNGRGIFQTMHILEDILSFSDMENLLWAEKIFDDKLYSPSIEPDLQGEKHFTSYFTATGLKNFAEPLGIIVSLFQQAEDAGLGRLAIRTVDNAKEKILFQDENQVVFRKVEVDYGQESV